MKDTYLLTTITIQSNIHMMQSFISYVQCLITQSCCQFVNKIEQNVQHVIHTEHVIRVIFFGTISDA
jgi:hypothetical protein